MIQVSTSFGQIIHLTMNGYFSLALIHYLVGTVCYISKIKSSSPKVWADIL